MFIKRKYPFLSIITVSVVMGCLAAGIMPANAQRKKTADKKAATTAKDQTLPKADSVARTGNVQPFDKVIPADAQVFKGLFTVYKTKDKYYFEIPDSLIGRDFQIISRLEKAPAMLIRGKDSYAGADLGSAQISFAKAPGNRLFITQPIYNEAAYDTSNAGLKKALSENALQPVLYVMDIKAYGKDSAMVIDMTDYLNGDYGIFTGEIKKLLNAQSLQNDRSYVDAVHAYPMNVSVSAVKTYSTQNNRSLTTLVNMSFTVLPKIPMLRRYNDERVGYKSYNLTDFDLDLQRGKTVGIINRWRMEPKVADMQAYMSGKLVKPAQPIVFYIDPATPGKWVPYLIKAVNDWQKAFEHAGFKDAIYALEAPGNDSTWDSDDNRFNTITYTPSIGSSISSNIVTDSRSGEIIHATIHIEHNVLVNLYYSYIAYAGAIDTGARKPIFDDQLMGELLQRAVSIQVGSSLGLLPNAAGSSTVPVDSLRNMHWLENHGISTTIMEDDVYNFVAQPSDHISRKGIMPQLGEYDKWAIYYGYHYFPGIAGTEAERKLVLKMVEDSLKANPRLVYGALNNEKVVDPRAQLYDLGNNAVAAGALGIQNLKRMIPEIPRWTELPGEVYSSNGNSRLGGVEYSIVELFTRYLKNVANIFGTYYYSPQGAGSDQKVYQGVPVSQQKGAMAFLRSNVFDKEPDWLMTKKIEDKITAPPYKNIIYQPGISLLDNSMLSMDQLNKVNLMSERFGPSGAYSLVAYLSDLDQAIWSELGTAKIVSSYHRSLQQTYINSMEKVINSPRERETMNTIVLVRGHLIDLKKQVTTTASLSQDLKTKEHYKDIIAKLDNLTDPKRQAPALPGLPGKNHGIGINKELNGDDNSELTY
ncbi:zinc-dependent metalloprotease [Chitinophaga sp. LS1]|uniref:zinc-dependent metalloprotease n=1 Tax=Chitinophaga sp. LS1 TaxID=3051176 RepID=UPI002AAB3A57|nr:zinc-dependent metalloprotease [Chitinophaga sp. LS1]WPV63769.1 zinc-dependent metalloprotease [Chitinophaga sp. LS1]